MTMNKEELEKAEAIAKQSTDEFLSIYKMMFKALSALLFISILINAMMFVSSPSIMIESESNKDSFISNKVK